MREIALKGPPPDSKLSPTQHVTSNNPPKLGYLKCTHCDEEGGGDCLLQRGTRKMEITHLAWCLMEGERLQDHG